MLNYLMFGVYFLQVSLLPGLVICLLWAALELILKRCKAGTPELPTPFHMLLRWILASYVVAIVHITSAYPYQGIAFRAEWAANGIQQLLHTIPFAGSSIKMITLNVLLFVPLGFLLPAVFGAVGASWKRAVLFGGGFSLYIELFQLFSGRLCEVDDLIANTAGALIGWLLWKSVCLFKEEKQRKRGLILAAAVIVGTCAGLFALSFVANGDVLEAQREALYHEMGEETDRTAVSKVVLMQGNQAVELSEEDWGQLYVWIGCEIGNGSGHLERRDMEQEIPVSAFDPGEDAKIVAVFYDAPQSFLFENNPELPISDIRCFYYDITTGTLWTGEDQDSLTNCLQYESEEYPFQPDGDILEEWSELSLK